MFVKWAWLWNVLLKMLKKMENGLRVYNSNTFSNFYQETTCTIFNIYGGSTI